MDRIAFVGHSTISIDTSGVRLLTDPVLRRGVHQRIHLEERSNQIAIEAGGL